jgi:hypothetical protein
MSNTVSRIYRDLDVFTTEAETKLNNPLPAPLKQRPSQEWLEFLYRTRRPLDKANEFICVHNLFYWRPCRRCNRSPEGAKYWKDKLLPRLEEWLRSLATE